ncbi:SPOR domain-containing protein [Rhodovulum strictum]|uniref:SPOR domain-containing protein n=1 Tax=Rhodovulum strictum TaxID=58314 RepID=A0A844B7A3_9RHOB|nr:SPOR domain-containing protein [Rhodovulum strictum]MRH20264.1 SPOR domain-containing protein [Rhodovulum strictum]
MAEIDYDAFRAPGMGDARPGLKTALHWAGGALSLSLVAGLCVWGYQILVRDVSGVPVVRALEGPMRIAPEDPGGRQAEHQGLAVNRVAADGEAAPPADTLHLAPRPLALAPEDLPRAELAPHELPRQDYVAPYADAAAPYAEETAEPSLDMASVPGLDAEDGMLVPFEEAAPDEVVPLMQLPAGALSHSPRPPARPDDMDLATRVAIEAALASLAPRAATELASTEVAAGTALVQLGAFDEADEARLAWEDLAGQGRFAGFFERKSRVIQATEGGGRIFYRLRAAGFDDIADARRFCAALLAEGAECIPVVAR